MVTESYAERRTREDREHRAWCQDYRMRTQRRLEALRPRGLALRAGMSEACAFYIVNEHTGEVVSGNGITGRTPGVLEKMLSLLEGALEGVEHVV